MRNQPGSLERKIISLIFLALSMFVLPANSSAQCPTGSAPAYASGCTSQYFTSITAAGTGVVSTISYSASSCTGTYFSYFATQGVTAPTGSTVNISVSRSTGYLAYLAVYVDWNNNGTFELTELVGSVITLPTSTPSTVYSFTIPLIAITTNTNLHMRVFLGEPPSAGGPLSSISPPCSAKYGESCDYYIKATCSDPVLSVSPASPSVCGATGSISLTASGAGATPTYSWSPGTGLSPTTGAIVTSTPGTTTTYTVTGYGPGVCLATTPVTVTVNPIVIPVISPATTTFCPGSSVTFSETSGTGTSYQWYNGTTLIPGATNSTFTASPAATTTYSVTVTSGTGCTGGTTASVTVLAGPSATISPAGPVTICSPSTTTLTTPVLPGATYRWFNPAGVIPGATNHIYTTAATDNYEVEVTAATGCKDTSATVSVTINPAPVASATASGALTFCSYSSVTFTAGAGTGYTYQWYDGLTIIPGATDISYTATATGTHDYRVKVTNSFGCSDMTASGLFPVVVNPAPVSTITPSGPLSFCTGSNVTLTVPFVAGYTYQWYYGATPSAMSPIATGGTSASYTTSISGYYYVKVTTPAGCTTNSSASPAHVTVVSLPVISYHTPLTFCWGSHAALSLGIGTGAGITFQWMRNGTNIPGATADSFNAIQTGTYACLVNVAGSCVGTTPSVNVTVNALPDPVITYSGGYLKTSTTYIAYQWYHELAPIAGATNYEVVPTTPANYSVIVTDANGCVSEATNYIIHTIILGAASVAGNEPPVIYPNPAANKVHVQYAQKTDITISSIDGKKLLENHSSNETDISSLSPGIYIVILHDEYGNRLLTQKLVKE